MLFTLLALPVSACADLGVMSPTVCENWVKRQLDNPDSYAWNGSNWNSPGPDVNITFTAEVDDQTVNHSADCNFVDPNAEVLRIDPARSSITPSAY